jgi:hypothetical protein
MTDTTAGKLAEVFLKIRDKRDELRHAYEAEDAVLKESLEAIESEMLEKCKEEDCSSIKTSLGTIVRSIKSRYWPADWDAFNSFVLEHKVPDLFEKRVHQTNMATWIESNPNDVPPGLNIERKYSCTVRRSK